MANIEFFGKWDLQNNIWINNPSSSDYGRSLAITNYDKIINDDGKIDYIIFAHGTRVENHFKNTSKINEKAAGISHIINHYKQCNGNYDIKLFLVDADAPIIEDAKFLAKYIECLADLPTTNSINVIRLSKCGCMNLYVPSFFKNPDTFKKTNIYNVASPYDGTKMASPLVLYPEVKQIISSKINNEKIVNFIYEKIIETYEGICSNSHMDYDIAIPGSVPDLRKNVYDKSFIENVFSCNNIEAIKKLNSFKNLFTGIDSNTLKEAISTMNFVGIGLCILNDVLFDKKSDGFVYIDSQRKIESILDMKSYQLVSSHHDIISNTRVFNDVLGVIDDTMDEFNDKVKKLVK